MSAEGNYSLKEFSQQCVQVHNKFRQMHGVPELKMSDQLTAEAKKWADHLAKSNKMQHATKEVRKGAGENLFWTSTSTDPLQPVQSWYDEIKDYDFDNPGYKQKGVVGHFTQVVWKNTKEMGIAMSRGKNGATYVVARYLPAGNVTNEGLFKKNVRRPRFDEDGNRVDSSDESSDEDLLDSDDLSAEDFSKLCLEAHNKHRRKHGVQTLKISEKLTKDAKKWADYLASTKKLECAKGVGESIFWSSAAVTPNQAVDRWYDEIKKYDFSKPGFKGETSHFSQLVWKSTEEMGVAVSRDTNGASYLVVRYHPQGNISNPGYFEENVLRPNQEKVKVKNDPIKKSNEVKTLSKKVTKTHENVINPKSNDNKKTTRVIKTKYTITKRDNGETISKTEKITSDGTTTKKEVNNLISRFNKLK